MNSKTHLDVGRALPQHSASARASFSDKVPPISLAVGERCNVRRDCYPNDPLYRVVTSAGFKRKADGLWFYWTWKPEPHDDLRPDCGYSGVRVEARS